MRLVKVDDQDFHVLWGQFVNQKKIGSWFYSPLFQEYSKYYCSWSRIKDCSFIITENNEPIAICPLFLEIVDSTKQFSWAGEFLRAPVIDPSLAKNHYQKIEKKIFEIIEEEQKKHEAKKYLCVIDPLTQLDSSYKYNWLMMYDFFNASINTQIINLNCEINQLWSDLRKCFKPLINKAKSSYFLKIFDCTNITEQIIGKYKLLHYQAAGKTTRPLESFQVQFSQILNNEAILIGVKYKDEWLGFSYFNHLNLGVYYSSSAEDASNDIPTPIGPLIQWAAIEYYRSKNFRYIEMGWQQFSTQIFDFPAQKNKNISHFKRGFGGQTYPLFRGIQYYDRELLKKDMWKMFAAL